jgi:hypothetical protein
MSGMPRKPFDSSKGAVVALLEGLLERAVKGEITYVAVVHDNADTDKVEGKWQGISDGQKAIDACKALDATRKAIIEKHTRS